MRAPTFLLGALGIFVSHGCGPRVAGGDSESHFVRCRTDETCVGLGEEFACVAGQCRTRAQGGTGRDLGAFTGSVNPTSDGGVPGALGAGGAVGDCMNLTPRPPPADVGDDGPDVEFVVAQRSGDFGELVAAAMDRDIGFDLDGQCNQGPSCTPRAGSQGAIDGVNGVDNAFSELVRQMGGDISEVGSAQYTQMLEKSAASNLIFHVTGYNGLPIDPKVGVDVLWAAPPAVAGVLAWNGSDVVRVDADSPGAQSSVTPNAYVSGGYLVAPFDVLPMRIVFAVFPIGHAAFDLSLTNATVQCRLKQTGSWELRQCVLGGVVQVNDLLHQLSRFPDPAAKAVSQPLCTDSASYAAMRANVCGVADVPPNLGIGGGFGVPSCGAVSVGMAFDMGAVQLGDTVRITTPQIIGCPAATDPANDNCIAVFMGLGPRDGGTPR